MNSNPRKVGRTNVVQDGDMLSSFHDSILCHILSFMPTKDAARTSILSERWKFLFLDVPKLAFSDQDVNVFKQKSFIKFVNRRLMSHTSIAEFRLLLRRLPKSSVINSWIISRLFRNLKVLEIREFESICDFSTESLPSEIFGWATLEVLKLRGRKMFLKLPKSVNFPNLKVLHLEILRIQSESESLRFDQKGYPQLEKLRLSWDSSYCSKDGKHFRGQLGIFLCKLEILELEVKEKYLTMIDVEAPRLKQLRYNVREVYEDGKLNPVPLSFCKSECLISAELYSEFNSRDLHIDVLSKMRGVGCLILRDFVAQDLPYPLPRFANLTRLYLYRTGVESMLSLLRSAPKLEVLVHQMLYVEDECFASLIDVPLCLAQELKQVGISKCSSSRESDVECVRFFLQHGAVLERVTLEKSEWSVSDLEQLLKLPRRSPKCEFVIRGP